MDNFPCQLDDLSKPLLTTTSGTPTNSSEAHPASINTFDCFLSSVYEYYRKNGLFCIILDEMLNLLRVVFLALFIVYISRCVNFNWWTQPGMNQTSPISIEDIFLPVQICLANVNRVHLAVLLIAVAHSFVKLGLLLRRIPTLLKLRRFFSQNLKINSSELYVTNWTKIQSRLIENSVIENSAKSDHIILEELLCHNIVLRHTNFIVGLMNCKAINFFFDIPIIDIRIGCFTNLMEMYLFKLFFPYKGFQGTIFSSRVQISEIFRLPKCAERSIRNRIVIMSFCGLILSPFLFVLQLVYILFEYSEMIRQSPSSIFKYRWSRFSYYSLRNYSEFDHELEERLEKAYFHAESYIKCFSSPLLNVIARHTTYFFGAILLLFFVLTLVHDSILQVNGIVTTIAVTTAIYAFGNSVENDIKYTDPDSHMANIIANIYNFTQDYEAPLETFKNFKKLFQSHIEYLLEQLAAPFTVPLVLIFSIRHKIAEIVQFVCDHTRHSDTVGDMCEYAFLDMEIINTQEVRGYPIVIADDKVETSLMAFSKNNASWNPPDESKKYLQSLNREVQKHLLDKNKECRKMNKMAGNQLLTHLGVGKEGKSNVTSRLSPPPTSLCSDLDDYEVSHELVASILYSRQRRKALTDSIQ